MVLLLKPLDLPLQEEVLLPAVLPVVLLEPVPLQQALVVVADGLVRL
jgi:hypothetical protein